jgi:GTP 3',8-cyclase
MRFVSLIDDPGAMYDSYGRHLHYLRVSLTDACNLRCVYCMPENIVFRPRASLMQDGELLKLVRVAVSLGVDKIRLTGGEPTVRPGVVELIRAIKSVPGIRRLTMTTNAVRLADLAGPMAEAGLDHVNISVDTLDSLKFRSITRRGKLDEVWQGIKAAEAAGLTPIKLNCVVTRGYNDQDVVELARLTLQYPWHVRFIELMPFGNVADFQESQIVSSAETRARIEAGIGLLYPVTDYDAHDPARPYAFAGAPGQVGFISSVTAAFCEGCTRLRLTADGKLRLCLLRDDEVDLLAPLRAGADFETLRTLMADAAYHKPWGHRLPEHEIARSREMSQIGG